MSLSKLKMPSKMKSEELDAELPAAEPSEEFAEGAEPTAAPSGSGLDLSKCSDDELMEELEKRGLNSSPVGQEPEQDPGARYV